MLGSFGDTNKGIITCNAIMILRLERRAPVEVLETSLNLMLRINCPYTQRGQCEKIQPHLLQAIMLLVVISSAASQFADPIFSVGKGLTSP